MSDDTRDWAETDIAVVGMAGRFPGARTPAELWQNVRGGVESIRPLSDEELREAGVDPALLEDPHYVKSCAPLHDMELFDSGFFGFGPREADIMDPQHRHFLECAWEALEDAGHPPEAFEGSIGVYGGCGMNAYFMFNLLTNPQLVKSVGLFLLRHTGNDKDFLTTRVSYLLNLTGPSVGVQTACSTSLVAIHLACQQLLAGECDLALAGGSTIEQPHRVGYLYEEGEILSPDGHCRAFDEASRGTVFGSGVGIVALRRLADAVRDGDVIHAVVRGSAVNNDGATKVGYLAPSVDGQASSILEALSVADVRADSISYVETHGTGTPVGDPIEIAALTQAFAAHTSRRGFCAIGSLKSNIGHLDTAAGVASFIKVVQALAHREIPPSLHFERPNPSIDFASTPFWVNTQARPWTVPPRTPRRAGVSSLGVGGTNAHVILEEAPAPAPSAADRPYNLLLLSARTPASLDAATARLARHFTDRPDVSVSDAAYTLTVGRRAFDRRRVVICRDAQDAAQALTALETTRAATAVRSAAPTSVVMLFPGGGAQHPDMGRDLYRDEPVFHDTVDQCLAIVDRLGHGHLRSLMYPAEADGARAARELGQPANSVLSVFVIEYALAKLWMSWGVMPAAMIGHSLGEYVAACLAGVMSLDDALALVSMRGRLFGTVPQGAMLSVALSEPELLALPLMTGLAVAAVNAPGLTVASGPVAAIEALERDLSDRGVDARRLHIDIAAHSPMLDGIVGEFAAFASTIRFQPPVLPYISNVTGAWADPAAVTTGAYWATHLRSTVRFSAGVTTLQQERGRFFLEVGPGQTLSSLVRLHRTADGVPAAASSLRHAQDRVSDYQPLYLAAGRLWMHGGRIDWPAFHGANRRRVSLPTYAWDHQRHWIAPGVALPMAAPAPDASAAEPASTAAARDAHAAAPVPIARLADVMDWALRPVWTPAPPAAPTAAPAPHHAWLVFAQPDALQRGVVRALTDAGHDVAVIEAADAYARVDARTWRVRPGAREDLDLALADLVAAHRLPDRIAHLWLAGDDRGPALASTGESRAAAHLDAAHGDAAHGFYALMSLAQAIAAHDPDHALDLAVVTRGLECVSPAGDAHTHRPAQALAYGPVRVIPREFPGISTRAIDLDLAPPHAHAAAQGTGAASGTGANGTAATSGTGPGSTGSDETGLTGGADPVAALVEELLSTGGPLQVALRRGTRWTLTYAPTPLADSGPEDAALTDATVSGAQFRANGVYVITGGLSGIGLALAEHVARTTPGVTLALVGRTALPPRAEWPARLASAGDREATTGDGHGLARDVLALRAITAMEQDGATVVPVAVDVTDVDAVRALLTDLRARHGAVHGIVHAAGVIDDGLVVTKTVEDAARVLAPKVEGTLALDDAVGDAPLDFLALCSSTSARLGLPGQIDYTAANAFLGAFARERQARRAGVTLAIDWGLWSESGMVARQAQAQQMPAADTATAATDDARAGTVHPLLGRRVDQSASTTTYAATYRPGDLWTLDEHRLQDGLSILPGTAYVEMARAAWQDVTGSAAAEIEDLEFLSPLEVADGQARIVRTTVTRTDHGATFTVESAPAGTPVGDSLAFDEHARARLKSPAASLDGGAHYAAGRPDALDWTLVEPGSTLDLTTRQRRHMRFGPRWQTLVDLRVAAGEAEGRLTLPAEFLDDFGQYRAHPALLDFATACGLAALSGYADCPDLFVPFSYTRIVIGPLPPAIVARVRVTGDGRAADEAVSFDVDLYGDDGVRVGRVEGFTMRRLAPERLVRPAAPRARQTPLAEMLAHGIRTADGVTAFTRALRAAGGPELIVSSIAWPALCAFVDRAFPAASAAGRTADGAASAEAGGVGARGALDEIESGVAAMWEELVGLSDVGLDDDFLMAGGHSLLAVRLASRIEKRFKVRLGMAAIFQASTVRTQAALIRAARAAAAEAADRAASRSAGSAGSDGQAAPPEDATGAPDGSADQAPADRPPLVAVSRDAFRRKRSSLPQS